MRTDKKSNFKYSWVALNANRQNLGSKFEYSGSRFIWNNQISEQHSEEGDVAFSQFELTLI